MSDKDQRPNITSANSLQRTANRQPERMRPENPVNLDYDYLGANDFIQGDLRVDVEVATLKQLVLLPWFMGGTFKVMLLLMIHSFKNVVQRQSI